MDGDRSPGAVLVRRLAAVGAATLVLAAAFALGTAWAAEGDLTFVECLEDTGGPSGCPSTGGVDGLAGASGVAVSPDGKHVYVASSGDDSLAAFARNPTTGTLSFVEFEDDGVGGVDGLGDALGVAVSPDGKHVYVAGQFDDSLAAFARNPTTGTLSFVEFEADGVGGVDGLNGAFGVSVSPDGKHVYVTGSDDNSLAAFARNPTTGTLSFVEFEDDGVGGADGLGGAAGVSVSPDGKHVYVTGSDEDSLAAFARNPTTGALSFVEFEDDGVGGVDGLASALGVAVSPDGMHVYVAGTGDDSLAAFARNPTTGALSFVEFEDDGVGGVDGLLGAAGVSVSPDGKQVYVASLADDSLAAFARNPTTGALSFVEFEDDGIGGVDGLDGARGVSVSPDGNHVHVAGSVDSSLAAFTREPDLTTPETTGLTGPAATTADQTPSFSFSSDDLLFTTFECRLDEGPFFPCTSPYTSFALADGPHRFQVRALDTAGNVDPTPAESIFTVDTSTPPEPDPPVVIPPDTTAPDTELTSEPAAQLTAKKKTAKAKFEFAASEAGSRFECRVDSAAFSACASPQNLKLKKGSHTFRVRAIDAAGNADFSAAKWQGTVIRKKKPR